ncbi:hypothetical protein C2845_PM03G31420 [Panicum miliaceum]|uniref:Uncharacterized protein n=1 Tax=Panicum miliaceum TaxID=4540 RepID=A0A3L6TA37_PANMI|nr:hypothetical protein C2845_PM03G31420 [Panicum miliaceum]
MAAKLAELRAEEVASKEMVPVEEALVAKAAAEDIEVREEEEEEEFDFDPVEAGATGNADEEIYKFVITDGHGDTRGMH